MLRNSFLQHPDVLAGNPKAFTNMNIGIIDYVHHSYPFTLNS